jgi:hypothetical protein
MLGGSQGNGGVMRTVEEYDVLFVDLRPETRDGA